METIKDIRDKIALCDDEIINALNKRMQLIQEIIAYKKKMGLPIFQPEQEQKQLTILKEKLTGHWFEDEILDIYEYVIKNSRKVQAKELFKNNIFLIGFMGSGKTTVSRYLAEMLALDTIDIDEQIEKQEQMSVVDIFKKYSEEYFRNCESNEILRHKNQNRIVISCGGGSVLREQNVVNMKQSGKIVLLTAKPATILERVKNSGTRPLLNGNMNEKFISAMMEKRRNNYMNCADVIISTDNRSIHEICEELISEIMKREV